MICISWSLGKIIGNVHFNLVCWVAKVFQKYGQQKRVCCTISKVIGKNKDEKIGYGGENKKGKKKEKINPMNLEKENKNHHILKVIGF